MGNNQSYIHISCNLDTWKFEVQTWIWNWVGIGNRKKETKLFLRWANISLSRPSLPLAKWAEHTPAHFVPTQVIAQNCAVRRPPHWRVGPTHQHTTWPTCSSNLWGRAVSRRRPLLRRALKQSSAKFGRESQQTWALTGGGGLLGSVSGYKIQLSSPRSSPLLPSASNR
jgi:hypothetical protein